MLKISLKIYIHVVFMRYMFRPQRAIFRQRIFKDSTALCTLSKVFLKYVLVIVINIGVTGCSFFLSFILRPFSAMYYTCLLVYYLLWTFRPVPLLRPPGVMSQYAEM
jgi:hypothetical protein